MTKEYTAKEVAEILGLDPRSVRKQCIKGKYKGAYKKASAWMIPSKNILIRKQIITNPKLIEESLPLEITE